jgi:polysaccharide pyruvyl transferase WcaK-like protein
MIVFITRTRTVNQGNQALSAIWKVILERIDGNIVCLERGPQYLKRFSLAKLGQSSDPIEEFERFCRKISQIQTGDLDILSSSRIEMNFGVKKPLPLAKLRQYLNIKYWLAFYCAGHSSYKKRLATIRKAKSVVVNPAGEFLKSASDSALIYLIELRVAQLAGVKTAIVNLTYEPQNLVLQSIANHVFSKSDIVIFRDDQSSEYFKSTKGNCKHWVVPDCALLTEAPHDDSLKLSERKSTVSRIAVAIHLPDLHKAGIGSQWVEMIDSLAERNFNITMVSNELSADIQIWEKSLDQSKIGFETSDLDFQQYMQMLRSFDLIISSRLHTCVFGIVVGVPVIPLAAGTFKISGFFRQIGSRYPVIQIGDPGWIDAVLGRINEISINYQDYINYQNSLKDMGVDKINALLKNALEKIS